MPKRSRLDRFFWKEFRFDCPDKTVRAEPSARATRFFTTQKRTSRTFRSCISVKIRPGFAFTTASFLKRLSSVSIMDTLSITPTCFVCGKRSSVISPTARKPLSTNSLFRPNQNGSGRAALFCFCRTVTKGRARNITVRDSSVFCKRALRTTSRSVI